MAAHDGIGRRLEGAGSGERLANIRQRFSAVARQRRLNRFRAALGVFSRTLLIGYWTACSAVIVAGVNKACPQIWPKMQRVLPGPALDRPFATCSEAHAAGVYNIPVWSPAYRLEQDGDGDGKACEPLHGYSGYRASHVRFRTER